MAFFPIRNLEALSLADSLDDDDDDDDDDDTTTSSDLSNRLSTCFKAHRRTTRLQLKQACNQRRLKYGKVLFRMFIKKSKVTLQSILCTATEEDKSQPLSTNLSILRDDTTDRLLVDPAEVIAQVQKLETHVLSPDPTLPHKAPLPWHLHVPPNH